LAWTHAEVFNGEVVLLKGFVMINVEPGAEKPVYDHLVDIKGIREVVPVYGENDFIAITDVVDVGDLNRVVLSIREIDGVTTTQTIVGTEMKF
jgi:DNA-binding Lrp family transcriptional regulator